MNKNFSKKFFLSLLSAFLIAALAHCGGGSPGPNIPAPVGELMSISTPDVEGLVKVSGMNGAVFPFATVVATNESKHEGDSLIKVLQKNALTSGLNQGIAPTQATTVADSNGAFEIYVEAAVKDEVEVVQVVEEQVSEATELLVPGDVFSVKTNISHFAVDPYNNLAVIIGNDDSNGLVYMLPYGPGLPMYSHPKPMRLLTASHQLSKLAINPLQKTGLAISKEDNLLLEFALNDSSSQPYVFELASPLSISLEPELGMAAIGLMGSNSIQLYDTSNHELSCAFKINNSLNEAKHQSTDFVDIKLDNQQKIKFVAASQFGEDTIILSRISFASCEEPVVGITQMLLPQGIKISGLASFDFGNQALVSDANSNRVYLVNFLEQKILPILVGDSPHEITIDELYSSAYVANRGDNSVSFIDLINRSVKTKEHIGLMPTAVGIFYNLEQAAVFSSFDNTLVFIDLDF